MVHPTVDGTPEGEISEEYIDEYASKNKIVFDLQEYRNKGGKSAGYRYMTRTYLKNRLKNENAPSIFKETDAKKDKRKKDSAFKYFSRKRGGKTIYELIQEGKLTMAPQHAPYLDEYKESLQTVVAQAN
jgi:hypothetical protein